MKLTADNAAFVFEMTAEGSFSHHCPTFAQAQGVILFECPLGCIHAILIPFANRNVPVEVKPITRWNASGTCLEDLTIKPSINLDTDGNGGPAPIGNCKWHGYITDGEAK